ncbi:MAG TPA: FKBP-type peptidyl-prolyl cis-trans isomerase [Solirubrobacterales bacterium]|jgi:peptidylprolyl isomerase|nr:FKBP-type peptidyl-prolyl cis-trans isomerase [Solirubrobacterales bacterium]
MRILALIGISLIAALTFASCGGSGSDHATAESTAATNSTAVTEAKARAAPAPHGPKLAMSKKEIAKLPKLTIAKRNGPPPKRLEVIDLRKGSGAAVKKKDSVFVRYFQVRYPEVLKRSQTGLYGPRSFGLDEVVKGWDVGLPGMKVGGRRELILPPKLVYPRWKPSWGYVPYTDIYVIDLLGVKRR